MYNKMSKVYDYLMMDEVDYPNWTSYIEEIFKRYEVEVENILDLGCGTGNITIPLCERGYELTGVDLSEEMLAIADSKAFEKKKNIKWIHGDMVDIAFSSNFDAIISCCDSLNYVLDDVDLLEVFTNAYNGLKSKGIFTFDMHSYFRINEIYKDEVFTHTSDEISYIWENNYDESTEVIEYYLNFFIRNEKDPYYSRVEELHYQRAYRSEDVVKMLLRAGFKKVDLFCFNTFEAPGAQTERLQFCCIP